jgi:hypothetical protein
VRSCPVDLDAVKARLLEISNEQDTQPQHFSGSPGYERSPTPRIDWDERAKTAEIVAYNELIDAGGRAPYPISLMEKVFKDPEEYRETLLPWQEYPEYSIRDWDKYVFQLQLGRWRVFRMWQKDNRDIDDEEEEFAAFIARERAECRSNDKFTRRQTTENRYLERLRYEFKRAEDVKNVDDQDEKFLAFLAEKKQQNIKLGVKWPGMTDNEYQQVLRVEFDNQRRNLRLSVGIPLYWLREDHGRGDFSEYVREAKRRLEKHGFNRTFQLDEDPTRQDELTTWIEYLNYEYSWYDRYERSVHRLQSKYDGTWKELVDSGVLRPGETDKEVGGMEIAVQLQMEEDQAREAVESAEAAARAALLESKKARTGNSRFTKPERIQALATAYSSLIAAEDAFRTVKQRGDLIIKFTHETWDYWHAKRNLQRQGHLLRWILDQVPVIEAEANEYSTRVEKRAFGHDQNDEVADVGRPSKRIRGLSPAADDAATFVWAGTTGKQSI